MNPPDEKKKVIPAQIPDVVYRAMEQVVGPEWISRDRAVLETYSKLSLDAEGFLKKHARNGSSIPPAWCCRAAPMRCSRW
jgi:hypothetical protein